MAQEAAGSQESGKGEETEEEVKGAPAATAALEDRTTTITIPMVIATEAAAALVTLRRHKPLHELLHQLSPCVRRRPNVAWLHGRARAVKRTPSVRSRKFSSTSSQNGRPCTTATAFLSNLRCNCSTTALSVVLMTTASSNRRIIIYK